jgi:hypothetical protein
MNQKFRIFGRKYSDYQTTVLAVDKVEAFEIALNSDSTKWDMLETDDTIEPTEVYGEDDEA